MSERLSDEVRVITGCDAVHPDRRGGQHVTKPCTGVLVIDDTRGLGVFCNTERGQHKNKDRALALLDSLRLSPLRPRGVGVVAARHRYCERSCDGPPRPLRPRPPALHQQGDPMMTDDDIREARKLCEAATSAPWEWTEAPDSIGAGEFLWNREADEGVLNHAGTDWNVNPENRAFIAASRSLLPRLLDECERLREGKWDLKAGLLQAELNHVNTDRDRLRELLREAYDMASDLGNHIPHDGWSERLRAIAKEAKLDV